MDSYNHFYMDSYNHLIEMDFFEDYKIVQFLGLFKYGSNFYTWYLFNRYFLLKTNELIPESLNKKFSKAFILKKNNKKVFKYNFEIPDDLKENIENKIKKYNYDITVDDIETAIQKEIQFPTIKYPLKYLFSTNNNLSHVNTMFQGLYNGSKIMKIFTNEGYVISNRPFVSNSEINNILIKCLKYNWLRINGSYVELTEDGNTIISILSSEYINKYFEPIVEIFIHFVKSSFLRITFVNRIFELLKKGPIDYYYIANNLGPQNDFEYHFTSQRLETYIQDNAKNISNKMFYREADNVINDILTKFIKFGWLTKKEVPYHYMYNNICFENKNCKIYSLTNLGKRILEECESITQKFPNSLDLLTLENNDNKYIRIRGFAIIYILYINNISMSYMEILNELKDLGFVNETIKSVANAIEDLIYTGFHIKEKKGLFELYNIEFDTEYFLTYLEQNENELKKTDILIKKDTLCLDFMFTNRNFLSIINLAYLNKSTSRRINDRDKLIKILLCEMMNQNGIHAECYFEDDEPDIIVEYYGFKVIIDTSTCRDDKKIKINTKKIVSLINDLHSSWNDCFKFSDKTIVICVTNNIDELKQQDIPGKILHTISNKKLYCGILVSIEEFMQMINLIHVSPSIYHDYDIKEMKFKDFKGVIFFNE